MQLPEEEDSPRKKKLKVALMKKTEAVANLRKKIRAVRQTNRRLMKRNAKLSDIISELQFKSLISYEDADILSTIDSGNKDFLKRFLGVVGKTEKFSPALRKFALCLHFISPRAYSYVREQFNTCLPHPQTLVSWYRSVDGNPGFTQEALHAIKSKVNASGKNIHVCLSFDEMSIRKAMTLDGGECIGAINIGANLDGYNIRMATQALVFMVTALNDSWKIPVGYFLIESVTAEQKSQLVTDCIKLLYSCNVNVISITCDGCPSNFAMAKILGCKIEHDVEVNPVFNIEIEGVNKEVCFFPDPPHMVKLIRNLLGNKHVLKTRDDKIIKWSFITSLHDLQEQEGLHLANKLRKAHINFVKQIMKVKLAVQTFSNSVADSIEFCEENHFEQFQGSSPTVDFIRKVNNLFDILNSRNINAYGYKKPLNMKNFVNINVFLNEVFDYLSSLKLENGQNVVQSNRKVCIIGLRCCIRGLQFLYKKLISSSELIFLPTYKLSQDHLESFFSAIRSKGGFNNNPSAVQFRAAYKRLVVHGELKNIDTGNCTSLENISILTYTNSRYEKSINATLPLLEHSTSLESESPTETEYFNIDTDHDYLADPSRLTEFSKQIIIYISGFIITKVAKMVKCENCLMSMINTASKNSYKLIVKKDKGGLHYPSADVIVLCEIAEKVFRSNLTQSGSNLLTRNNLLLQLMNQCIRQCIGKELFKEHGISYDHSPLDDHKVLLMKAITMKYLQIRIYKYTKQLSEPKEKVRNLYTKLTLFRNQ